MKIYTKGGDKGTTSLAGGKRCIKCDERVEAYGSVDELMSFIALLMDKMDGYATLHFTGDLARINNTLMSAAGLLASVCDKPLSGDVPAAEISFLEERIDAISAGLEPLKAFVMPGGHVLVSLAHVCRTVCRRAERAADKAASLYPVPAGVMAYLNRLSDYLFTLSRRLSKELNVKETYWVLDK